MIMWDSHFSLRTLINRLFSLSVILLLILASRMWFETKNYLLVVIVVIKLILFIIDIGRENSFRSPAIDRANNAI